MSNSDALPNNNLTANAEILERLRERLSNSKENQQREHKRRYLIFRLADSWFAVEAGAVREISRLGSITKVPLTRDYVIGVVNLRGNVTAVVDIRDILGVPRRQLEPSARIIVLAAENLEAGILADAVAEVVEVTDSAIEPPLITLEREQAAYILGNFNLGEKVVSSLNPSNLLLNLKV